ncbi:SIMPL domain-containing protein [Microbacterium suwonense]|uniref:SIMPL domain-containing protein n=1 Tax=Microbacterium suwonense TaxID=683047 RepID=A0ABN6X334_9MICO|nr:SIMPL domain-containing protein [Microbacterium suwonense]BDZ38543.1 SIMPL domain-containing protein [Microbacterium suwonense]
MSDVIITVRSECELRVAPDRATVHLVVAFDGPDRTSVVEKTLAAAGSVRAGIESRDAAGTVLEWSSDRMNVVANRPWNSEGRQLAPVHRASVDFSATFADFSALSDWVTDLAEQDGVSIGYIDWHLTPEVEAETEREVATRAVGIALARARAYAAALGLHEVTPLEIADRGMISDGAHPQARLMRADAIAVGGSPELDLKSEEIVLSATVEGRFTAK